MSKYYLSLSPYDNDMSISLSTVFCKNKQHFEQWYHVGVEDEITGTSTFW